jgi:hypothetical protein
MYMCTTTYDLDLSACKKCSKKCRRTAAHNPDSVLSLRTHNRTPWSSGHPAMCITSGTSHRALHGIDVSVSCEILRSISRPRPPLSALSHTRHTYKWTAASQEKSIHLGTYDDRGFRSETHTSYQQMEPEGLSASTGGTSRNK